MSTATALTIGNFDGVHFGHQTLIGRARSLVGASGTVVAATLFPHPMAELNPARMPMPIEPVERRCERLREAGADEVVVLEPTPELLGMSPGAFVDRMIEAHRPTVVVEGSDFRFGARRAGSVTTLQELCGLQGVAVEVVPSVVVALSDQSEVVASSTITRWLLAHGRVRDAGYVLGRVHELSGTVVRGDQLGRTIGFPTINLSTGSMLPGDGVYAGVATTAWGERLIAAVNVGARPTVDGRQRRAEAYLLEMDGTPWTPAAGGEEYGWGCTLGLVSRVRDELRFASIESMCEQVGRDVVRICEIVRRFAGAAGAGVG